MDLIKRFNSLCEKDVLNGYLYLSKEAVRLLGVINEFTTFSEVSNDLYLLDKKQWFVSEHESQFHNNLIKYEIRGHGFLKEQAC